jgi:tRNA A-37 threonylcarbamoyl transferase component Bud32
MKKRLELGANWELIIDFGLGIRTKNYTQNWFDVYFLERSFTEGKSHPTLVHSTTYAESEKSEIWSLEDT